MISVHLYASHSELCIRHFRKNLKHDPDNLNVLTQLAILLFLQYEDMKAIGLLKNALVIESTFVPALVAMGEIMRFTGDSKMAGKYYLQALKQDQY